MKTWILLGSITLVTDCLADPFVNLTFDDPDLTGSLEPVSPRGPFRGETARILRGWDLILNGVSAPQMGYYISGQGGGFLYPVSLKQETVNGGTMFNVEMASTLPNSYDIRLLQTGTIPADALGIRLFANTTISLSVNGDVVFVSDTSVTGFPTVNIAQFAGQTVNLEFRLVQRGSIPVGGSFDILGFTQVPEPSTWSLFGLGAVAFGWMIHRRL
jgi:hypothetical protein